MASSFWASGALGAGSGADWVHWDAALYRHLATVGYDDAHLCAMFPGFPLAVRAVMTTSLGFTAAAMALNGALLFAALVLVHALAARTVGPRAARISTAILAFHPLSFYFSIPYGEALFVSACLASVLAASHGRWWAAAAAGALAVLTRNSGILLLPALLLTPVTSASAASSDRAREAWRRWPLVAMPLALAGWMAFTWLRFGDPWLFVTGQRAWRDHLRLAWPLAAYLRDVGRYRAYLDHHLPLTTVGVAGLWLAARRLPRSWLLYAAPAVLLSLSLSKLAITPRLHLTLFPLWIGWAAWLEARASKRALVGLAVISAVVQAGLMWRYGCNRWVE